VKVSALTGAGIGRLRSTVARRFRTGDTAAVAGTRHLELFRESRDALASSLSAPDAEAAALELRAALASLDLIDAPASNCEILDRVFARFCVGK
jgi:tRNA modification GTPase